MRVDRQVIRVMDLGGLFGVVLLALFVSLVALSAYGAPIPNEMLIFPKEITADGGGRLKIQFSRIGGCGSVMVKAEMQPLKDQLSSCNLTPEQDEVLGHAQHAFVVYFTMRSEDRCKRTRIPLDVEFDVGRLLENLVVTREEVLLVVPKNDGTVWIKVMNRR